MRSLSFEFSKRLKVLIEKDHEIYQRRGTDLIMRKKISLQEALCGFNMNIKTLQKEARFVPITTAPGQVIQDKMLYRVPNEGKCFQNDL